MCLSLTTVKRPEMKDVLKETGKLIKVNICFDKCCLLYTSDAADE